MEPPVLKSGPWTNSNKGKHSAGRESCMVDHNASALFGAVEQGKDQGNDEPTQNLVDNKDVLPSALACEMVGGAAPYHTRADDDNAAGGAVPSKEYCQGGNQEKHETSIPFRNGYSSITADVILVDQQRNNEEAKKTGMVLLEAGYLALEGRFSSSSDSACWLPDERAWRRQGCCQGRRRLMGPQEVGWRREGAEALRERRAAAFCGCRKNTYNAESTGGFYGQMALKIIRI